MHEKVMASHFDDLVKLTDLLKRYVDSYRLLVSSAAELNTISERRTKEVERAIDRVNEIGGVIDDLINIIEKYQEGYLRYSKFKNDIVISNYEKGKIKNGLTEVIQTEINNELNFFNASYEKREDEK
ncbi:DNA primase large subunit [Clostridium moniliforme]|uniref:DNA primase large subunit n=1 Tax=Clostridium moniliforme TaxID=39489 RepID=A0ABS4EZM8_9CLOT|nr:hypothetical protein [Clostridium moniliforme]MBP1889292.1 DNA primase large subunit [Clostridium moniliforme]